MIAEHVAHLHLKLFLLSMPNDTLPLLPVVGPPGLSYQQCLPNDGFGVIKAFPIEPFGGDGNDAGVVQHLFGALIPVQSPIDRVIFLNLAAARRVWLIDTRDFYPWILAHRLR